MHSVETLEIAGYRNKPVPNTFFWQQEETRHLGILFPGLGYTSHMPLLYYPGRLLLFHGADLLRVEYAYEKDENFHSLPPGERSRWLAADATAACSSGLSQRNYDHITLIGKSIGTLALGHLITTHPKLRTTQCIWLTPLLRNDQLRAQISETKLRALFVIGTVDPHYDRAKVAEIGEATGGEWIVIEGADHSMEIEENVMESIQALHRIMEGMEKFLLGGSR
jgi:predicted alpha/beta-hydrolase family hydrolase